MALRIDFRTHEACNQTRRIGEENDPSFTCVVFRATAAARTMERLLPMGSRGDIPAVVARWRGPVECLQQLACRRVQLAPRGSSHKGKQLKPPLAVPGRPAYRRVRACLEQVTDPSSEVVATGKALRMDATSPAFRVRLRSRRFRNSPRLFAFLQFGIGGQMLRFHPFEASAGEYEFRVGKTSGLAYLTEPNTGRTWAFTVMPFRNARRVGRAASAIAIASPYPDLQAARWNAPRLTHIARWLKALQQNAAAPSRDGQPVTVTLSGAVVAGLHIIDPVTGRQLVTLRSHSLRAGEAQLTAHKEALSLTQGSTVVHFAVDDLLSRWGNQLTRSAIHASAEASRQRSAELRLHSALRQLIVRALVSTREPDAETLAQLEAFNAAADRVCSDARGRISMALDLPRRLGGCRRLAFRLDEFGPRASFQPGLWWIPHQGLMVSWTAASGSAAAFGISSREVRRFGVFQSAEAARNAARQTPSALIAEIHARRRERELDGELRSRIAHFNNLDLNLKADQGQVPVASVFSGTVLRFQTPRSRGLWSPKVLLSSVGPLWVMFARTASRKPAWRVYRALPERAMMSQLIEPVAEGRGRPTLDALAITLSKQLSARVTAIDRADLAAPATNDMHHILRRVVPEGAQAWHRKDSNAQVRLFYELAEALRQDLLSPNEACKREALVAAEYFYFGKPSEQIVNLHAPLFKPDAGLWSAVLGEGGHADARVKDLVRNLGVFVFERPKQGLPATLRSRFAKFQGAVLQLGGAQGGTEISQA